MPKKDSGTVPENPHAPVSNQPETVEAESAGKPVSQPPSEGTNPDTTRTADDGTEAVPGFGRTERALERLSSAVRGTRHQRTA